MELSQSERFSGVFQSEAGIKVPLTLQLGKYKYMRAKRSWSLSSTPGINQAKKIKLVHREKVEIKKEK